MILLGSLAGWNGYATYQQTAAKGTELTTTQIGAVSVPAVGALGGGVTAILAWLAQRGVKTEKLSESLKLLQAIATLIDNLQGPLQQASEQFKKNGFPPSGKIELQWTGAPPVVVQWGPVTGNATTQK